MVGTKYLLPFSAKSVESSFLSHKLSFPTGTVAIDITKPEISRLLKQVEDLVFYTKYTIIYRQ